MRTARENGGYFACGFAGLNKAVYRGVCPVRAIASPSLRNALRAASADAHSALDDGMAHLDLTDAGDYRRFLSVQLAARVPVEGWLLRNCPPAIRPTAQSGLIQDDLSKVGGPPAPRSDLPFEADPDGALGVAWALGGSSLGNRAMLAGMRKRGSDLPTAFLGDPAMPAFFARIRPSLEREAGSYADLAAAISAARTVFATFAAALDLVTMKRAA